ncbi:hypothetical protein CC1G_04616 [Coprinopsis cinerea okayama7|uniref:MYND-type domain-containing protein n=1 Tax=Coprinopsis cinerea (strain Okayama-7 / 130 / ATCC MYA-4618 / FGSC 9003) TaxID=240176 RepID=A8N4V6_COPC7|nr:hypothetical protein CC1G_04616 [Coprinopsis cinerea okayama7\|eukprot:XP_001829927.1 hypothetical protein CC1G_04616 [Coprinopsis cinerea okayama7\
MSTTSSSEPLVLPLPAQDTGCGYPLCPNEEEDEPVEAQFRCSVCKNESYCGLRCQKLDWKNHKWICSPLAIDSNTAFLKHDPEELEELTQVIRRWKEAFVKIPDSEKKKKGWKASSMPESQELLNFNIASGASYTRLPKDHTKRPFRLPITLIIRRFLSSMLLPPIPSALETVPDSICKLGEGARLPHGWGKMYGPKVVHKPADLSPGEYETVVDLIPIMFVEQDMEGELKEWGDRWLALSLARKMLWNDDGVVRGG